MKDITAAIIAIIGIGLLVLFFIGLGKSIKSDRDINRTNFFECMEKIDNTQWCYDKFIIGN